MFYRKKEIIVSLSSDEIVDRLWKIKRKSPLFQKIEANQFRVRINSNIRSLFKTSVSGVISGKILPTDNNAINKIIYHTEPPVIIWFFSLFFLAFLTVFFRGLVLGVFAEGAQPDIKAIFIRLLLIFLFEGLIFAESLSQTNTSEERFLRVLEPEAMCRTGDSTLSH